MFKKIIAVFFVLILICSPFTVGAQDSEKPEITATAYVLYNPDNNEIVESKNQNSKMYPASLTKMMTALVVMDLCKDLDKEKVTVSEHAIQSLYGTGSSTANIRKGEIFTVRQLLNLMLIPSGNDAANALADHYTTDQRDFVNLMNEKANKLGMKGTHFVNPHGLHDANHYSTAKDLAILADAYMNVKVLYNIANTTEYKVPTTNLQAERYIRTTNYMKTKDKERYYYSYSTGLKTGYTKSAGRCFAGSAEKNGEKFILISLNTPEVWDRYGLVRTEFLEAAEYFEYAFDKYDYFNVAKTNQKVLSLPVYETRDERVDLGLKNNIFATLPKDTDLNKITIDFKPQKLVENKYANSPVKKGDSFGIAKIMLDGKILGECEVVALESVSADGLLVFWHKIDFYVYLILGILGFIVFVVILLIVRKYIVLYMRKKRRQERELRRQKQKEAFLESEPYDYFKMD